MPILPLLLALAVAADPAPACDTARPAIPPAFAGWTDGAAVSAGTRPGDGAAIAPGRAVAVSLHPARHLALAPAAGRTASADGNGGTLTLTVTSAGTYRIALGGRAWIDVVRSGATLESSAHGHGPACSGIRKIVDFRLEPGSYAVQLSGSAEDTVTLMVAKS